jgi:predicted PurR-regulated permease PerM
LQSSTRSTTSVSRVPDPAAQPVAQPLEAPPAPPEAINERPHARARIPRLDRPSPSSAASRRSLQTAFALSAIVLGFAVLYLIRDVMGAFVLGALLAFLIGPFVDRLQSIGVPRPIGILVLFALITAIIVGLIGMVVPLLVSEFSGLQAGAPAIAKAAQLQLNELEGHPMQILGFRVDLTGTTTSITSHANDYLLGQFGNAVSIGITALTTAFQIILMLIVAFLVTLDSHRISRAVRSVVPIDYRVDFDSVWSDIKGMLYAYMRGQLIIAAMIGISSGVAVQLLGLPYALALGLLAATTSLVPYLGPFLGAIPAVLIGLSESPEKGLLVAVAYLVVSNVILNFVFPKLIGDAVRLPPILVITAFIAGFSLAGILGMFIAIPVAATLRILYDHIHPRLFPERQKPVTT